jgi:hypothetical protein
LLAHCAFDADRAYQHVQALCYPRRVGTAGERQAAEYVDEQFAALGLARQHQPFSASLFPAEIGGRLVFVVCAVLILAGAALVSDWPLLAALCWGGTGLLIHTPWRVRYSVGNQWPPRRSTQNLIASLSTGPHAAPVRIVFMAHYDTKSQLWPTGMRVGLVYLATAACAFLTLQALAAGTGWHTPLAAGGAHALVWVVLLALAGLLANITGNRSPGALDNASAVGTLLELARCWRPLPERPAEVVWVATAAEEVNLDGARWFLQQYSSWWHEKPTLLINLESVGAGSRVYLSGELRAVRMARDAAKELGIGCAALHVLGAGMDHEPFAAQGFPALSILGDVVRKSFAMHSARDTMNIIEKPALQRAGLLASHLAWRWIEMHLAEQEPSPAPLSQAPMLILAPKSPL